MPKQFFKIIIKIKEINFFFKPELTYEYKLENNFNSLREAKTMEKFTNKLNSTFLHIYGEIHPNKIKINRIYLLR